MAFLGLVPVERSTGEAVRLGRSLVMAVPARDPGTAMTPTETG
jgi:hypothetical protein